MNRFLCDVLEEMRTAVKVGRIDMVHGLIEEAQSMGNRMEAKLGDYRDMGYDLDSARKLKNTLRELTNSADIIENKLDDEET